MDFSLAVLVGLGAFVVWKLISTRRSPKQLDEAKRLLAEEGAVLVDVRTPAEFSAGHAPGAINLPLSDIPAGIKVLPKTGTPLVIHCASGTRSRAAAGRLKSAGYSHIVDVATLGNARKLAEG